MTAPFVVYGALSESLRGAALLLPGLVLLGLNVALLVYGRVLHYDGYVGSPVYWLPLLTVAVVLPIAYLMRPRGD